MPDHILSADEFIELAEDKGRSKYKELAEVVIALSYAPEIYKMVNWFSFIATELNKMIENDHKEYQLHTDRMPSLTRKNVAFNQDTLIRCMLDTMVQRAGGIVNWDTGDAGWGQLYAIISNTKEQPCPGGQGYMLGVRTYLQEKAREEMDAKDALPELYADEEYDGSGAVLDMSESVFIKEVSDDRRRSSE